MNLDDLLQSKYRQFYELQRDIYLLENHVPYPVNCLIYDVMYVSGAYSRYTFNVFSYGDGFYLIMDVKKDRCLISGKDMKEMLNNCLITLIKVLRTSELAAIKISQSGLSAFELHMCEG